MAPTVVKDKVLIGTNGGEYGIRGFVRAYDAKTGKQLWNFHTIPENSVGVWATKDATGRDMHRNIQAEKDTLAKIGDPYAKLGGGVWRTPRSILRPTGSTSSSAIRRPTDGSNRPGDNLYTNSLVSLDLETGKYVRHFQYIAHDVCRTRRGQPDSAGQRPRTRTARPFPASSTPARPGTSMCTIKGLQPDTLSDAMVLQENMWVLPTKEGARMLPGANGASNGRRLRPTQVGSWPTPLICTSR
jgi:hypothetical protein